MKLLLPHCLDQKVIFFIKYAAINLMGKAVTTCTLIGDTLLVGLQENKYNRTKNKQIRWERRLPSMGYKQKTIPCDPLNR